MMMMMVIAMLVVVVVVFRESREDGGVRDARCVGRRDRPARRRPLAALLAMSTPRHRPRSAAAQTLFRRVDRRSGSGSDVIGVVAAVADRVERLVADGEAQRQRRRRRAERQR